MKHNISKFLSLVLRHKPEALGVQMDSMGWVSVFELLEKYNNGSRKMSFADLEEIVCTNPKQRFIFNSDKTKIRANQGHSLSIDLDLKPIEPPEILYHGTVQKYWESIQKSGLEKRSRNHVHLSLDKETAIKVGIRHGKDLRILKIKAKQMYEDGYVFYLSENGVYLTDFVKIDYIVLD